MGRLPRVERAIPHEPVSDALSVGDADKCSSGSERPLVQVHRAVTRRTSPLRVSSRYRPCRRSAHCMEATTMPNTTLYAFRSHLFKVIAMADRPLQSVASQYIGTWKTLAISSDSPHVLPTYGGESSSWTLPYGLFPHTLLGLNLLDNLVRAFVSPSVSVSEIACNRL